MPEAAFVPPDSRLTTARPALMQVPNPPAANNPTQTNSAGEGNNEHAAQADVQSAAHMIDG